MEFNMPVYVVIIGVIAILCAMALFFYNLLSPKYPKHPGGKCDGETEYLGHSAGDSTELVYGCKKCGLTWHVPKN